MIWQPMTSNIEPIAREITRSICRDNKMPEIKIDQWVELHWQCAAAMLEAGVMNEKGEWIDGKDWRRGSEAYRERLFASSQSTAREPNREPMLIESSGPRLHRRAFGRFD